eukprot:m.196190 g.196190  ORF g.196190 m.196190 type:complete len:76 (-) comp14903_c0_seq6:1402-1629(-)
MRSCVNAQLHAEQHTRSDYKGKRNLAVVISSCNNAYSVLATMFARLLQERMFTSFLAVTWPCHQLEVAQSEVFLA